MAVTASAAARVTALEIATTRDVMKQKRRGIDDGISLNNMVDIDDSSGNRGKNRNMI